MAKDKALFLDRDGVINVDHGYTHKKEGFDFVDGIFNLCRVAAKKRYKIFVVTNQAGIGKGYYLESDFFELTSWMCEQFRLEGINIEKVYFSPYHIDAVIEKYKEDHLSRKPNPGMLLQAQEEFNLDMKSSVMVGDKKSDIEAGLAAGVGLNIHLSLDFERGKPMRKSSIQLGSLAEVEALL